MTIRLEIPEPLRVLARVEDDVRLEVEGPATAGRVLDALEARYPALKGTLRDPATGRRRPFIRFYACGRDLSHEPADKALPERVQSGEEPLLVIGAVAGG